MQWWRLLWVGGSASAVPCVVSHAIESDGEIGDGHLLLPTAAMVMKVMMITEMLLMIMLMTMMTTVMMMNTMPMGVAVACAAASDARSGGGCGSGVWWWCCCCHFCCFWWSGGSGAGGSVDASVGPIVSCCGGGGAGGSTSGRTVRGSSWSEMESARMLQNRTDWAKSIDVSSMSGDILLRRIEYVMLGTGLFWLRRYCTSIGLVKI